MYVIRRVGKEVSFNRMLNKKQKKFTIPATIKLRGKIYKVTTIDSKAFYGNKRLKSVVFGKNIKKIGAKAFANTKGLKKLYIQTKLLNKKSLNKNSFKHAGKKKMFVKAPKKKKALYRRLLKKSGLRSRVVFL